jgi:hypothetical protein
MRSLNAKLTCAVALASVIAIACDRSFDCTLIGCLDAVIVHLSTTPTGAFTVRVRPIGSADTTQTVTCDGTSVCGQEIRFVNMRPPQVEVTVTQGTTSVVTTATVNYTKVYPNGPNCGVGCTTGKVTAATP